MDDTVKSEALLPSALKIFELQKPMVNITMEC